MTMDTFKSLTYMYYGTFQLNILCYFAAYHFSTVQNMDVLEITFCTSFVVQHSLTRINKYKLKVPTPSQFSSTSSSCGPPADILYN